MGSGTITLMAAISDGRLFGLDMQTLISIIAQLFNFVLLAAILTYLLYKPVRNFMQKRTERIEGQFSAAEEEMANAKELKAQYEKMLADIEQQRIEILDSAQKAAKEKSKLLLDEATKEAEDERKRAAADILMEQERVKEELRLSIINVSSAMAQKIISYSMDQDTQNRLFDETMAELEEIEWRN